MIIKQNNISLNLPDFLIVGAAKSGTTSLYFYLQNHPAVFLPAIKEPSFFSLMGKSIKVRNPNYIYTCSDYANIFKRAKKTQIIGEASPAYLFDHENVIGNIKEIYGKHYSDIKIIIILRNPIERLWSQYLHFKRNDSEPLSLEEAILPEVVSARLKNYWNIFYDYIGAGLYFRQVSSFLSEFNRVKIVLFDEFIEDTPNQVKEVLRFLEVNDEINQINCNNVYNKSGVIRFKFLSSLYKYITLNDNIFKHIFKFISPANTRMKLRFMIDSIFLKKEYLDNETYKELMPYFQEDISNLKKILKDKGHLLDKWINNS